jgi:metal-responsive CopG/Arc/MetJ family transcriptional regulator
MVRPKEKEPKHQFSVMLKPSTVDEIDKFADKYNLTRSQLMANLMETGLDEMRTLDKIGIVPLVYQGSNLMKKFKEKLFNGKVSVDEKGDIKINK